MKQLTKDQIIQELYTSEIIEEVLSNITKGNALKEDLRGELFLILCEMNAERIKKAYNEKYLLYMCINILKKQYNSSTSPFHSKYRKNKTNELDGLDVVIDDESYEDEHAKEVIILTEVNKFLDTLGVVDRELFKIYYKMDDYDRWNGEKRDTTCKKNISSTRKIERKLALQSIDGQKRVTIDHSTIANSLKKTLEDLTKHLKKLGLND